MFGTEVEILNLVKKRKQIKVKALFLVLVKVEPHLLKEGKSVSSVLVVALGVITLRFHLTRIVGMQVFVFPESNNSGKR